MARKLLWILGIVGLLFVNLPSLEAEEKQSFLFVDSRLLLIAHPLFRAFDPTTRRFIDTPSDPSLVRAIGQEGMKKKIAELGSKKLKLTKIWQEKIFKARNSEVKKLEIEFLREKKAIEKEIELLKGQQFLVKVFPERPAFSELRSILPSVKEISKDIRKTFQEMRERHKADLILDIAPLFPSTPVEVDTRVLFEFSMAPLWKTKNAKVPAGFAQWTQQAKNYWANQDVFSSPVIYGGTDCRLEAMKFIRVAGSEQ